MTSQALTQTMRTRLYRAGNLAEEDFPAERISNYLAEPDTVVWLDLLNPDQSGLAVVTEEFGFHPLAVEDVASDHERPKLDRYDSHLFLNIYTVRLDARSGELTSFEASAFITGRALITVRRNDEIDLGALVAAWDSNAGLASHGVGFLVHGLLDHVVDGHFAAVQALDEEIEGLEDLLFLPSSGSSEVQRRSFELRKSLVLLRRVVLPMREVVNALMRHDSHIVDAYMEPYFQDVYDHVLRVTEWTESLRDLVSTILETNLSIQSNRLNEVMKKLTAWAAIIAVPTAITGFYGQNVPYPGFGQHWGFFVSTGVMVAIAAGLWVAFKRQDWL